MKYTFTTSTTRDVCMLERMRYTASPLEIEHLPRTRPKKNIIHTVWFVSRSIFSLSCHHPSSSRVWLSFDLNEKIDSKQRRQFIEFKRKYRSKLPKDCHLRCWGDVNGRPLYIHEKTAAISQTITNVTRHDGTRNGARDVAILITEFLGRDASDKLNTIYFELYFLTRVSLPYPSLCRSCSDMQTNKTFRLWRLELEPNSTISGCCSHSQFKFRNYRRQFFLPHVARCRTAH